MAVDNHLQRPVAVREIVTEAMSLAPVEVAAPISALQ